jgi:Uma2 family endonuclease
MTFTQDVESPVDPHPSKGLTEISNRFLLTVSWGEYLKFLDALGDRPIRVTYDRGSMELMSPTADHEFKKKLLANLLEALLVEWDLDFAALGSTTFRREDLDRGLEPDECYWILQVQEMRYVKHLDLSIHPVPELAIEVEVHHAVINRLGILHSMGFPEIWRLTRQGHLVCLLWDEQGYTESPVSRFLPGLPVSEIDRFLERSDCPRPRLVREFISWANGLGLGLKG